MLNMLNPFYNYIGSQLVSFFEKEASTGKTDRYYLYLPTKDLVDSLYDVFNNKIKARPLFTRHDAGSQDL